MSLNESISEEAQPSNGVCGQIVAFPFGKEDRRD